MLRLETNIDDMTAEDLAFAQGILLRNGALDVWSTSIGMKKGRPACMLSCLCRPEDAQLFRGLLFKHTTTLGIREAEIARSLLSRRIETRQTPAGEIRVKIAEGPGIFKEKMEFDDLCDAAAALGASLAEVRKSADKGSQG